MVRRLYAVVHRNGWFGRGISGSCGLLIAFAAVVSQAFDVSVITSFDRAVLDKREHAASQALPAVPVCDTMYPGLPVQTYVFFDRYARNHLGYVDLAYSCRLVSARGKSVFDTAGIVAFSGFAAATAGTFTKAAPVITVPRTVPPGSYRLLVTAFDKIDETSKTVEKELVAAALPSGASGMFDVVSFNVWVHNYCLAPDPARAIPAFSWFIASDMSNNDEMFWGVFYFFQCLFRENPALVDELLRGFGSATPRLREYTVFLLRAMGYEKTKAAAVIPDSLWHAFDNAARGGFLDPLAVTCAIGSARLLEFGFYYYGSYPMVRFLIDCLGAESEAGYAALLHACNRYRTGAADNIDRKTASQLSAEAKRIITKAYPKHLLVRAYCDWALVNNDVRSDARRMLREIIAAAGK